MHEPSNVAGTSNGATSAGTSSPSGAAASAAVPIGVRRVTAQVDTGRVAYGEPATANRRLPADAIAVTTMDVTIGLPDQCLLLWRFDVDAELPQPEGRAAAFQEQETFAAIAGLEAVIDVPAPAPGITPLCLYQHKEWWMRPTWVQALADVPPRTQMLLYRCTDGRWVVLLAVSGDDVRADFAAASGGGSHAVSNTDDCALRLIVSSNKTGRTIMRDVICYAAIGENPYHTVRVCVEAAARRLGVSTRRERPFPEALTGLGWCTWDSLGREVSESAIIAKMEEFRAKDVPISWVLIDDGWSDTDRVHETLRGFDADRERFPYGLVHTVDLLKRRYGVRSVGVWQAFQGYWAGIDPDWAATAHLVTPDDVNMNGPLCAATRAAVTCTANGCLIPAAGQDAATQFWDTWDAHLTVAGVDFVKVDSQSSTSVMTRGSESYGEATWGRHRALDTVTSDLFDGALINCMGMSPEDYWHRPTSPITRTSDDYLPHHPESLAEHLIENAYCALLLGELYHCDWDMFWTEHSHAWTHAVLRGMSGGPVYCSDALGHTDAAVLRALLDPVTGRLRRPDEPARPIVDSLLADPTRSSRALGVEARFGSESVIAFIGLREGESQWGVIEAGNEPLQVTEFAVGDAPNAGRGTVIIPAHGRERYAVDYGRIRLLRIRIACVPDAS